MSSSTSSSTGTKRLGAWFPSATVAKAQALSPTSRCTILLFYYYCRPSLSTEHKQALISFLQTLTTRLQLGGRLRVANEGLNCTISGTFEAAREFANELINWSVKINGNMVKPFTIPEIPDFKYIDDLPPDRAFKDVKIIPVNELVFYGVDEKNAPLSMGGVHLDPIDYHEKMKDSNAVIIDVRNHYEANIGKFDGQVKIGGAQYIDPLMRKSTDFKSWLGLDTTKEKLKGKEVLMFCTGGVRCERASAYLKTELGHEIGGVYQLQGGIEKYLQEFPDGGHWTGKNFVFDKREAFGVNNLHGVGGVVEGKKKKKKNKKEDQQEEIYGNCCVCSTSWDRYIGKKKCYTCGVPVLMCDSCMSLKPDKTPGKELSVRCPLCVMEKITIPAMDMEFTANGVVATVKKTQQKTPSSSSSNKRPRDESNTETGRAAMSVLKWGGGHATEKKKAREMKRKPCNFGDDCKRSGCWFSHPRDSHNNDGTEKY